jgi:hypothetical protein
MDKVHKLRDSEYYTPSSGPFSSIKDPRLMFGIPVEIPYLNLDFHGGLSWFCLALRAVAGIWS